MCCSIAGTLSLETKTESHPLKRVCSDAESFFRAIDVSIQIFGSLFRGIDPVSKRICISNEVSKTRKILPSEDDALFQDIVLLSQAIEKAFRAMESTSQAIKRLSELNIEFKEANVKVKDVEEKGVDGNFHTGLNFSSEPESCLNAAMSTELAYYSDMLPSPLSQPGLVPIRDELRSLPFLQSGL